MIYFTSDLHFYHTKIKNHSRQFFYTVEEMNNRLIKNWNNTVRCNDEVYILGDVTMKGPDIVRKLLSSLNGKKYLIRGNHDNFAENPDWLIDEYLTGWVKDYYELHYNNFTFVLCHYPLLEWNKYYSGSYHLHGHLHSTKYDNIKNLKDGIRRYDVGVDANNFFPVSIDDIILFFEETNP